MNYRLRKLLGFALIFLALTGCRVVINVPENGGVTTASGAYGCRRDPDKPFHTLCGIDIYDLYFDEEFIAVPDPGFKFVGWKKRDHGLCGGKTTSCNIVSGLAKDNELLMELLESHQSFYLEPVFENASACRASDSGTSNKITLQQGESAIREIRVPRNSNGSGGSSHFEGCPSGVKCSVDGLDHDDPKFIIYKLKFSTTSATPTGKYNFQYHTFKGGKGCTLWGGCYDSPEKIQKRWKFKLKVVECPL
jgi:hypothetical protein